MGISGAGRGWKRNGGQVREEAQEGRRGDVVATLGLGQVGWNGAEHVERRVGDEEKGREKRREVLL